MSEEEKYVYSPIVEGKALYFRFYKVEALAVNLPSRKRRDIEARIGVELGGGYKREEESDWVVFINDPEIGTMPLEAWKESWKQRMATAISGVTIKTGYVVRPSQIEVAGTIPPERYSGLVKKEE